VKLTRYPGNPILSPNPKNAWEAAVATNPGAWYDADIGRVTMLYRAAGHDEAHRIYLGLASSTDGFHFERASDRPAVGPGDGFDAGCVEDPRIVKFGQWYAIVYPSRPHPPGRYWLKTPHAAEKPAFASPDFPRCLRENLTTSGLLLTKDFKTFIRAGRITDPALDDRDCILFPEKVGGRFVLLHRPMSWVGDAYGTDHPAMWIAFSDDLMKWPESRLLATAKHPWECKIGGNTPPIRTPEGWLALYHAVGPDLHYRLGAMLLDIDDPATVRHRTPDWLIQPEADYELEGYYQGCIFPCGAVVIDGRLIVYYGGADKYVAAATCDLAELVDHLTACPP